MNETNLFQHYSRLATSENPDDRAEAARELKAFLSNENATVLLVDILGDADWRVRRSAVESFLEMRPPSAVPLLLQALYSEDNAGKRNAAIDILTGYGREIIPHLKRHLGSENTDVRMFLVNILGDLRDDTYLEFITQLLDHSDANLVSAAIFALGKIGRPESLNHLIRFLRGDDLWLKFQAIEAAGEMQDVQTLPELIALYESEYCRAPVIHAIGKFHHPDAYAALSKFLVSGKQLNVTALETLVHLYHTPAPAALRSEEQKSIREECSKAIGATSDSVVLLNEFHNADKELKKKILEVCGWSRASEAIPVFIDSLKDTELTEVAAQALVDCGEDSAAPLLALLQSADSEDQIVMALNVLNEICIGPAVPPVEHLLKHEAAEVRYHAYKMLARTVAPEAANLLVRGVLDRDDSISTACREPLLAR